MAKVLRFTRHPLTPSQEAELIEVFGEDVEIETLEVRFPNNPREAVELFDELTADPGIEAVEVVLPTHLLQAVVNHSRFVARGGQILRAKMLCIRREGQEPEYEFDHYEVVDEVVIRTHPLSLQKLYDFEAETEH